MASRLDNPVAVTKIADLTEAHVQYFRDNPGMLDLISDRDDFSGWKYFVVLIVAVLFVGGSKLLAVRFSDQLPSFISTVLVDVVFEMGAALIGAVATVIFISFQIRRQFERNLRLRIEIERRIALLEVPGGSG